ncbi:MAG: hypothetical protein LVO36_00735 [Nitrosopumilus sp. (ex Thoosa mismalolli)]|nr:hypothetical protein [Nitrosopumilus sp. (ex Thoosa mismalolli)]
MSLVSIYITTISAQPAEIPEWLKNNARWWTTGSIDDSAFVSRIEFLISEGIIYVPITQKTVNPTDEIPSWIRTTCLWH